MNRSTTGRLALGLSLALVLLLTGCASSTGGGAADVPREPPAPVKKPFTPPAFASTEWKSAEHGFLVHYPSDFEVQPAQGPAGVFTAASPMMAPRLDINVLPVVPGLTLEAAGELVKAQLGQLGGGEAKLASSTATKLQDGVSPAMEFVVEWTFQGFPLNSVVVLAPQGDKSVNLTVTGMQGGDLQQLRDIAYTLYFP